MFEGIKPILMQLSIIKIQLKHNNSGILNDDILTKKQIVEIKTQPKKVNIGIHIFFLQADTWHLIIIIIILIIVIIISQIIAK